MGQVAPNMFANCLSELWGYTSFVKACSKEKQWLLAMQMLVSMAEAQALWSLSVVSWTSKCLAHLAPQLCRWFQTSSVAAQPLPVAARSGEFLWPCSTLPWLPWHRMCRFPMPCWCRSPVTGRWPCAFCGTSQGSGSEGMKLHKIWLLTVTSKEHSGHQLLGCLTLTTIFRLVFCHWISGRLLCGQLVHLSPQSEWVRQRSTPQLKSGTWAWPFSSRWIWQWRLCPQKNGGKHQCNLQATQLLNTFANEKRGDSLNSESLASAKVQRDERNWNDAVAACQNDAWPLALHALPVLLAARMSPSSTYQAAILGGRSLEMFTKCRDSMTPAAACGTMARLSVNDPRVIHSSMVAASCALDDSWSPQDLSFLWWSCAMLGVSNPLLFHKLKDPCHNWMQLMEASARQDLYNSMITLGSWKDAMM